jgi:hypothetical protein
VKSGGPDGTFSRGPAMPLKVRLPASVQTRT